MIECPFFGEDATLHHVGLAVDSIKEVSPDCEIITEETQRVYAGFLRLGDVTIELLQPLDEKSPIARSLHQGVKLLHLCYEVTDIDATLERCKTAGFHMLRKPVPAPAFENRRIVWVYNKQFGLFELLERQRSDLGSQAVGSTSPTG